MYMDTQKIETDIQKVTDEAIERWINLCLMLIQHKSQKQKENENGKKN